MAFDNACKYLSETYPREFATWILGEIPTSVEILKTELSIEPIRADHVTFLRTTNQILHLEFEVEVEGEPPLPLRMLDYWVRLYRRYRLPVTQAIILLKPSPAATNFSRRRYATSLPNHPYLAARPRTLITKFCSLTFSNLMPDRNSLRVTYSSFPAIS